MTESGIVTHVGHLNTNKDWGGGEYQILKLVTGLIDRGIRSTLFAHPRGELFERARKEGLLVEPIPVLSPVQMIFPEYLRVSRRAHELGIDLLHVHDSRATTIGSRAARKLGIPVVLTRRVASPIRRNLFSRRKYSRYNLDAVIAISQIVKDVFAKSGYPPECIYVVASGVDIDALDQLEKDDDFRQGYTGAYLVGGIGKLSFNKNWQLMVRVAENLARKSKDIHWVLVGEGPELRRLKELAKHLDVQDRFHFMGFRKDATRMLKSFDVLFHPSLMEGASVTIREAMILGVPVVTVDTPGSMESLDGHGWVVKADDVEGAAQYVFQALIDKEKRQAVCERARESAIARFGIDRTVEGTIKVYRQVMSEQNMTQILTKDS